MKSRLNEYVKPWVNDIEAYIPGKTIEGYVKLASNENNYGPSPRVMDAIEKAKSELHIYPHKDDEVREKIAEYCNTKAENIILGNGSDELFDLILKTFKGPCIGFNPSYSWYKIAADILGEEYLEVNLNDDFTLSSEQFIEKSKKANILFLCSPNNPTGTVIPENKLREILDENKVTVIDEAYYEFYGESAVPLLKEYDNLIVLRTFAKAFALAGLRIGYGIANSNVIDLLYKVKMPFTTNSIAQEAAISALDDLRYTESTVNKIIRDREILFNKLRQKFRAFKSHANFVLIDTTPIKSKEFYGQLLERGIIIRNLGKFNGFEGEYCRISVGTSDENRAFIRVLEEL